MRGVITGIGVISPIGCNAESYWQALISGHSGIRPIKAFDARRYRSRIAGEALDFNPWMQSTSAWSLRKSLTSN
jgi:3-oxoacyl-(acyl-carrier-protein) synthase